MTTISVESLMDTPEGRDEVGVPDDQISHCKEHDVLYTDQGACLHCEREHKSKRSEAQHRKAQHEGVIEQEARAVAGPEIRTDGGEDNAHASDVNAQLDKADEADDLGLLDVGDWVVPDGRDATTIVMRCCSDTAGEYYLEEIGETVAEYNDCDPGERVYQVVFADRTDKDLADCRRYPYPRSKLTLEERLHDHGDSDGGDS